MFTKKHSLEMKNLMDIYHQDAAGMGIKEEKITTFCQRTDELTKSWGAFFLTYTDMVIETPDLFPDPSMIINILMELTPRATEFAKSDNDFAIRYQNYTSQLTSYLKDQTDIYKEISNSVNIDNNIFTFKANQVMRIPELKTTLDKLFDDHLIMEEEMNSIEKIVASIRIPSN